MPPLFLLLLLGVADAHAGRLACSATRLCGEADRRLWTHRRARVERALELRANETAAREWAVRHSLNGSAPYGLSERLHFELLQLQDEFCADRQTAGFLLRAESAAWPLACVWTASDVNGTCAPAPPARRSFDFVDADQWRTQEFRTALGCPPEAIAQTRQVHELFVCRARCLQGGVGFFFSLFVLFGLVLAAGVLFF
ncbi:hypothetical protein M3Y99_00041100 [Aphelenchoides fujianensis]|nr:hypothetical protein M3Y99_00041100 [Aphelenchoides fujianensis]